MIDIRDIHSLTDFQRNAKKYVNKINKTRQPLVLTVNGKPGLVVHDAESYQQLMDKITALEDLEAIREGIQDVEAGRVIPWEQAEAELRKELGIQDRLHAKSTKRPKGSVHLDQRKLVSERRRRGV
jgi:prevent-host-death family protein